MSYAEIALELIEEDSERLEVDGFTQYNTGGGCMALHKSLEDGSEILITDHETSIPAKESETVLIGFYDKDGDDEYYENVPVDAIQSLLNAILEQDPDSAILAKYLYKSE
tara:strand:- start:1229 stop:1558 length:330 start_codon:yes stop_codon:yes gene_type:complete